MFERFLRQLIRGIVDVVIIFGQFKVLRNTPECTLFKDYPLIWGVVITAKSHKYSRFLAISLLFCFFSRPYL